MLSSDGRKKIEIEMRNQVTKNILLEERVPLEIKPTISSGQVSDAASRNLIS